MSEPKISFVMPTRNRIEWIGESLQSLLTQTIVHETEIIIVNDASDDGTKEFLDSWASKYPEVKIIHNEKPLGAGQSRNIGMNIARSPIIAVCDDDDINADERAALILKHFEMNPESELVTFPYQSVGYYNEPLEDYPGEPFDHEGFKSEGRVNFFSNPSCAFKKEAGIAVGGYEPETVDTEKNRKTDDIQFLTKWVKSGRKVDFQPGYMVCFHRVLPDSMMAKLRGWRPEWAEKK